MSVRITLRDCWVDSHPALNSYGLPRPLAFLRILCTWAYQVRFW